MATIDAPAGICGAATRASARNARAFAFSVQSQCLSSVSSALRTTPVAALWTSTSSGPSAAHLREHAVRRDVAADEHRLGAGRAQLLGGRLGGLVVAEVADRDALRAVAREAQRDRAADPARAAGDEDVHGASRRYDAARQRAVGRRGARDLLPARPRRRLARRPPRPSTTRGRGGRAAPSSPRRSGARRRPRAAPRRARSTRARSW